MFTQGNTDAPDLSTPESRNWTLRDFLDIVTDETIIYDGRRSTLEEHVRHHTIPQTHPFNCLQFADFVGRTEQLQRDWFEIQRRLGLEPKELPRMNITEKPKSLWPSKPYRRYYDNDTRRIVERYFKEDLERFNYKW
jgi:hypothetical protein